LDLTYTEAHFNPRYFRELKVKLPTKKEWGIPPRKYLTYVIRPYDVNSKYIQCLKPTEEAPGLSIKCGLCEKELLNHLHIGGGLPCFSTHKITRVIAPRFCLEAMARAAYEYWELDYDYETYVRERDALERSYARVAEFMERFAESFGKGPKYKYVTRMGITEDKRIVYVVSKEEKE